MFVISLCSETFYVGKLTIMNLIHLVVPDQFVLLRSFQRSFDFGIIACHLYTSIRGPL